MTPDLPFVKVGKLPKTHVAFSVPGSLTFGFMFRPIFFKSKNCDCEGQNESGIRDQEDAKVYEHGRNEAMASGA